MANDIGRLTNLFPNKINLVKNTIIFYVNKKQKLIPHYDIFNYYFLIDNNSLYINDYEFTHLFEYFDYTYNKPYLVKTNIFEYNSFPSLHVDKCILIRNMYSNVGHSFFNILQGIYIYYNELEKRDDYKIVICDDLLNYNKFLISLVYLFFPKETVLILPEYTLLNVDEFVLIKDLSDRSENDDHHITFLLSFLHEKIKHINKPPVFENICLLKTFDTLNTNHNTKAFDNSYKIFFENKNFKMMKPEEYSIEELCYIIYNCKNLVLSWGCCSYLNSIFVNPTTTVTLVLCHFGYKNEYDGGITASMNKDNSLDSFLNSFWFPKSCIENKKYILDMNTTLNDDNKEQITELLNITN